MDTSEKDEFQIPAQAPGHEEEGTSRNLHNCVRTNKKAKLMKDANEETSAKENGSKPNLKLPKEGTGFKQIPIGSMNSKSDSDNGSNERMSSDIDIVPMLFNKPSLKKPLASPSKKTVLKVFAKAFGDDMILSLPKRKDTSLLAGTPRKSATKTSEKVDEAQNMAIIEALTLPEIQSYIENELTLELLEYKNIQRAFGSTKEQGTPSMIAKGPYTPQPMNKATDARMKRASVGNPAMLKARLDPALRENKSERKPNKGDASKKQNLFHSLSFKLRPSEIKERLNKYVPIALFLADQTNHSAMAKRLFFYDKHIQVETGLKDITNLFESEVFVVKLLECIVLYDEHKVFNLLLTKFTIWDIWFRDRILDALLSQSKISYLSELLMAFIKQLKDAKKDKSLKQRGSVALLLNPSFSKNASKGSETSQSPPKEPVGTEQDTGSAYVREKMLLVIKKYFNYFQSNSLLLDILNNIDLQPKEITELLIMTQDEDRVVELLQANETLTKHLDPVKIITYKQYKLLIVFDSPQLVNIFNMPVKANGQKSKRSRSRTVFQELCHNIKSGIKIQSLCFMIMNVDIVFWDFDRCWSFYQAINNMVRQESRVNWLAYVDNPLLFSVKMSYFFRVTLLDLGVESKEIDNLRSDLSNFCIKYMYESNDETLIINFFDKDSKGLTFIDYAFMNKKYEILEVDFVARIISRMWDLGRDSKKSLREFFRLTTFYRQNNQFTFESMTKSYKIPIERDDAFHLDYLLTSHSVYLSVLSDVLWLILLIISEFLMSMKIVHMHRKELIDRERHWLLDLHNDHYQSTIVFLYFRCSFTLTCIARLLAITWERKSFLELKDFYYIYLILTLLQMVVYPYYLHGSFWPLNIMQMLITVTLIIYGYYLSLAFQLVGVVLRIFARMFGIVVMFGLASMVVICALAFPIHVIFVDFTQLDSGDGKELNLFYDLYTGVLTMFEFVFGAVIFVRPYLEENWYTHTMTFVMVLFSFFGNIMLANLLVAFLANQFSEIMKKARYYTLKMQYQLTTILRPKDLDSVYSLPFWLWPLVFPLFILMAIPGKTRKFINSYLRRTIHVINTAIPWLLFYTAYLVLMYFFRYLGTAVKIVLQLKSAKLINIPLFFAWIFGGPFFLMYLLFMDIFLVANRLFDLTQKTEVEMHMITFDEGERKYLCGVFMNIFETAQFLIRTKKIRHIPVRQFVYDLGRHGSFEGQDNLSVQSDSDSEDSGLINVNSNKFMVSKKYRVKGIALVTNLVQKFVNKKDKVGTDGVTYEEIDLQFVVDKLKNNLVPEKIHLLIAFNKEHLETAREEMISEDDRDNRNDVRAIRSQLDDLTCNVAVLVKSMQRMESKMNKTEHK